MWEISILKDRNAGRRPWKSSEKAISGEGSKLMKAEGTGKLYVADSGKKFVSFT